jgi:peptide/nickel transport system permease protein
MIAGMTAMGQSDPESVAMMREALRELYGTGGPLMEQYFTYWRRISSLDFGPSLSAFPTPVSVLIGRALPWTVGLLLTCTLIAWTLGNLLGGLAGYYRDNRPLKALGVVVMGFHPVPYYIIAFVLLIVFGLMWPVLPTSGGAAPNVARGWNGE